MDRIQRKELRQAASELKRAQSAKEAAKNQFDAKVASDEADRAYNMAQTYAEKAYQVVETYAEKVEATKYRIEAILGR